MRAIVYISSAVISLICTLMLLRGYWRSRTKLLLWSAVCFAGLTLNNILLYIDRKVYPDVDLSLWRNLPALAGFIFLLYGLIWDTRSER
jgi:hypothetical protein